MKITSAMVPIGRWRLLTLLLVASLAISQIRATETEPLKNDENLDEFDDYADGEGDLTQEFQTENIIANPPVAGGYVSPDTYNQSTTGSSYQMSNGYDQQPVSNYGGQPQPLDTYNYNQSPQVITGSGYNNQQPVSGGSYNQSTGVYPQIGPAAPIYDSQNLYVNNNNNYSSGYFQQPVVSTGYVTQQPVSYIQLQPPVVSYTQPQPQVNYVQPQPQVSYVQQPQPQPQVSYVQPQPQPQVSYVQPQPQPVSSYAPVSQGYQAPKVVAPVVVSNYTAQQPAYPSANYSAPLRLTTSTSYAPRPSNYSVVAKTPVASYPPATLVSKPLPSSPNYGALNLFLAAVNYWPNSQNTYYYKVAPFKSCGATYKSHPGYKDIEAAFAYARAKLAEIQSSSINYMDATSHSFAARHQVFSLLSQISPRMDEEGLLIELVSRYLADRACLTKWDIQRYLPQLTAVISASNYPAGHSCNTVYSHIGVNPSVCYAKRYRTIDGFCNNPYHPYWGKSNVCHIRLMSPDYADGISAPRVSYNPRFPLPNPRIVSNIIHHEVTIPGPYNLMKMQWGQLINHDITNTALNSYEGLVDCCKNPNIRGCWPINVPPGDPFYGRLNVTCLNFVRSGICPLCQLGPRQQTNKNTAFLDCSHVYGTTEELSRELRQFKGGLLKTSVNNKGDILPPLAVGKQADQCAGICYLAGDPRVNQHPTLTVLHTIQLRRHNQIAYNLALRHPNWSDELLFQEARRIMIAEYQMITYAEYLPIVFGPYLSEYYKLVPLSYGYTQYNPKADPTTWNEYSTATCRFGHSQISNMIGVYNKLIGYGQNDKDQTNVPLSEWYFRPSIVGEGLLPQLVLGLLGKTADTVDPWLSDGVRNHLYRSFKEHSGGDLAATNIWRGRDHGIPGYVHYLDYCFNYKAYGWKDLALFIPPSVLNNLRKVYKVVENIDLFTGGMSERHFPGADIGPTFACVNGIQYYHIKYGDRFYFEHGNQVGSFNQVQIQELRQSTLARLLCKTANIAQVPRYAFLQPSPYNPVIDCSKIPDIDYSKF